MSATASQSKHAPLVLVGTYAEPQGSQSEGIYAHRIDPSSGELRLDKVLKGAEDIVDRRGASFA